MIHDETAVGHGVGRRAGDKNQNRSSKTKTKMDLVCTMTCLSPTISAASLAPRVCTSKHIVQPTLVLPFSFFSSEETQFIAPPTNAIDPKRSSLPYTYAINTEHKHAHKLHRKRYIKGTQGAMHHHTSRSGDNTRREEKKNGLVPSHASPAHPTPPVCCSPHLQNSGVSWCSGACRYTMRNLCCRAASWTASRYDSAKNMGLRCCPYCFFFVCFVGGRFKGGVNRG